jgi:RNA polymerase primary sigma factor
MNTLNRIDKTGIDPHLDSLELYWREIKDNEPLDRQEEVELFTRVRAGDQAAVETLVKANLRFVVSVAREYCQDDGPVLMDLIAEGNMGLMRAIRTFDETRGFKFITYAVWWIRQAMRKSLHTQYQAVRLPASHTNDLQLIDKETAILSQELGRSPTFAEIAERVELGPERLHNAYHSMLKFFLLDF